MKSRMESLGISIVLLVFILALSMVATPVFAQQKGLGVVKFDAEYTTYRNETRSYYRYGSGGATINSDGTSSYSPGKSSTETVTTRVPVKADYELPFQVVKGDSVIYDGYTPVRVTNFTPGETYTIIWIGTNGKRKTGSFTVPSNSPYTKYLHLE